ncbi:MAG: ACP S-malonyltransferase [Planctomycetes bacterium]|nr:ACP S-malonyltransferase [Planctomycetota bacterium]
MKTAFLFPGQGAQIVGMGKDVVEAVPAADRIFQQANDILGYDLRSLCFEGPEETLNTTAISQPAIFVTSVAILEAMRTNPITHAIQADIVAGLSLGEYTAIYAARVLPFDATLRLVQKRAEAMQAASDATDGGMVSLIGGKPEQVQALCAAAAQGEPLQPANYNCPGQIVISGSRQACHRAESMASEFGVTKAIRLKVAGAFHTELMTSAAQALSEALNGCTLQDAAPVLVLANTSADYYPDPEAIKPGLVSQLTAPILWQASMEKLVAAGVESYYEIGPGRVLTGLMRRIDRKTRVVNLSSMAGLEALAQATGQGDRLCQKSDSRS